MIKHDEKDQFLKSTKYLDWKSEPIQSQYRLLITEKNILTEIDKAIILFNFVRDDVDYRIPTHFLHGKYIIASHLLQNHKGNCLQKSIILATLGRAAGIPTRLHFVDIINHIAPQNYVDRYGNELPWHCYMEFYLTNRWVVANPDYPTKLCNIKGYPIVQFDGEQDAFLPEKDLNGNLFIEYINDHGWFADLPKFKMQWNYAKAYLIPFLKERLHKKK